jgi:hypothetical protein
VTGGMAILFWRRSRGGEPISFRGMRDPSAVLPETAATTDDAADETTATFLRAVAAWCRRRGPVARGAFALAVFTAASIAVFAGPVITDLGDRCVGSCFADTRLYTWSFAWMHYARAHDLNPLFTSLLFAPSGWNLAWVTTLPGPALVMVPFTSRYGPLFSVNVLMIAAPALAGWATYLVCVRVSKRFWPSIAGGALFAFSTYMGQHMRAHLNLVLLFFVPLAVYLVLRRIDRSLHPVVFVLLLGLVLAGEFSTSLEVFATMTFFGGIAYLGALAIGPRDVRLRLLWTAPLIAASYALALVITLPILRNVLSQPPSALFRKPFLNSADLISFVVPRAPLWIGGSAFRPVTDPMPSLPQDDTAYIGIALLAVVALFLIRFRRQRWAWGLVGFAVLVAVLALGPVLYVAGRKTTLTMPQAQMAELPLIQHALPERFPAYMFLALAVIVALWLAQASGRGAWWRYGLVALGIAMMSVRLGWEPHYHMVDTSPSFFEDGTYRDYLSLDETILAIPREQGGDLAWQVAGNMDFRLARAYIGPVGKQEARLRMIFSVPGEDLPPPSPLARFLVDRHVGAVIVEDPVQPDVRALLDQVVGTEPTSVGGVSVWDVPSNLPELDAVR